jgi:Ran-binding protein 1
MSLFFDPSTSLLATLCEVGAHGVAFHMPSTRSKKAAAAQRVSALFSQQDAQAQPALQTRTFQFETAVRYKSKPDLNHPASDQLFATVAALQYLCDEYDMDHVSPPPMWPMTLHGAMPSPFVGDDAIMRCLDAIVEGNKGTIRLAIGGAIRILESRIQRGCFLQAVPSVDAAVDVCMRALKSDERSAAEMCNNLRLIGLLCQTTQVSRLPEIYRMLIIIADGVRHTNVRETCLATILYVGRTLARMDSDTPLLDELRGLVNDKLQPHVSPAAAGLLMLVGHKAEFHAQLCCSIDQLLRREGEQDPQELWIAAALLAPERWEEVRQLAKSRIAFHIALRCLDGPPDVAEPATALFAHLSRQGWGDEYEGLAEAVLKRMPRLLTQADAALQVEALSCIHVMVWEDMATHHITFFVEKILPVLMQLAAAPVIVTPSARCPEPLRSQPQQPTWRCIPTATTEIIANACAAHAEVVVPALLESPQLSTFFRILHTYNDDGTSTTHSRSLGAAAMHVVSMLVANDGYARVVRAVGAAAWHQLVDNYAALPWGHSEVILRRKLAIGAAILRHEDVEQCLRILSVLRARLVFGQDYSCLHEELSLPHAVRILDCCATSDERTADGWTVLQALVGWQKRSIVALIHERRHVLVAALQHPSLQVRRAALRCAAVVVSSPFFPRTDRPAIMDVLVSCLGDLRARVEIAAVPCTTPPTTEPGVSLEDWTTATIGKSHECEYNVELDVAATLWRFDEGEARWTMGTRGTAKILTHKSLADKRLFVFRDAEGKAVAYHPLTADTQLAKIDDVTWEWRAEQDYADDDEGFPEQFKLSLQSAEHASQLQRYFTLRTSPNRDPAAAQLDKTSAEDSGVPVRNPFLAAVSRQDQPRTAWVSNKPPMAAPTDSSALSMNNPFAAYKPAAAVTGHMLLSQTSPVQVALVDDEFIVAARNAFGRYSTAAWQTYAGAVLHAGAHSLAKNVKRPKFGNDDRAADDEEYRLEAMIALRGWCNRDVTWEPEPTCLAAQHLIHNGGVMEIALIGIASYCGPRFQLSHSEWNGGSQSKSYRAAGVACEFMTLLLKYAGPGALREALGEAVYTAIAALVTLHHHHHLDRPS